MPFLDERKKHFDVTRNYFFYMKVLSEQIYNIVN